MYLMKQASIKAIFAITVVFSVSQANAGSVDSVDSVDSALDYKKHGDWFVGLKVLHLAPDEESVVSIGGEAKVASDTVPEIDLRYFLTDNLSLETMIGVAEHSVSAVGTALGDLDLGSTKVLPLTLSLQYHFNHGNRFSPYIGVGLNHTFYVDHDPGDALGISYEDGFGTVLNIGFDYFISEKNYFNIDIKTFDISTNVVVNAGPAGIADASVDLNLLAVSVGYGWVF